ncbi:ankyrin repeat-containing domain protein [Trichophaea hybrida]|nr:ankyrin repeat-containing domain protein [Trichophaea hybrida]
MVLLEHELQTSSFTQAAHAKSASAILGFKYCMSFPKHSAVHIAASCSLEVICELLLGRGSSPNTMDDYSRTPLFYAVGSGHETVVQMLLGRTDVDLNSKGNLCRSPLATAAEKGHGTVVQLLLDHGADVNSKDIVGRTPLIHAMDCGHEKIVQKLLNYGVDVNPKDVYSSRTPFSFASRKGYKSVAQLLLDHVADAETGERKGRALLFLAASNGIERYRGPDLENMVTIVQLLLDHGVDKDNIGRTPLSQAAGGGHEKIVRLLLSRAGVNAESKDEYGRTPLWQAAERGHEKIEKLLLSRSDVNAGSKDNFSRTPLSYGSREGMRW